MSELGPAPVTVVIPTIPSRLDMLARALASVENQTQKPECIAICLDSEGIGAPAARTKALRMVKTEWAAFLDDDDEWYPQHLQMLYNCAKATEADMVFPWFEVRGGSDPFPHFGRPFDNEHPHQTTVTFLVKTEVALAVGGFIWDDDVADADDPGTDALGHRAGEEFRMVCRMAAAGYKIVHLPEKTWRWHHHTRNTMGLPTRTPPRPDASAIDSGGQLPPGVMAQAQI